MHVASVCVYFRRRQVVIPLPNKGMMGRRDGQQMCEGQAKEKLYSEVVSIRQI